MKGAAAAVNVGLVLLMGLAFVASLVLGSTAIPVSRVVELLFATAMVSDTDAVVVWAIRVPRSLTAMLAGASLSVAGLQMQTLFRNPLADPFALGVTAGATLGVALLVLGTGLGAGLFLSATTGLAGDAAMIAAAMAGALLVLALVMAVSARVNGSTTVLVLGLMAGYATSACVTVLVGVSEPERLQQWASWGFGSFSGVTWSRLWLFAPATLAGIAIALGTAVPLNLLLLGDSYAASMGLAVRRVRLLTMFGASLLGAVVTAFCGPISFLGIAVPHLCRGLLGTSDHRVLVPAVVLMGATAALVAQIVSLIPGHGVVLPLNAVTALLGAPVVVAVVVRGRLLRKPV